MRAFFGPLLLHVGFATSGLGVLRAAGVVEKVWSFRTLAALGLAYLLGIAAVIATAIILLVIGLPFTNLTIALLIIAFTLLLAPTTLRELPRAKLPALPTRAALMRRVREMPAEQVALCVLAVAFVVFALIGLYAVSNRPIGSGEYDAWNLWARKANLMFQGSHLPTEVFKSPREGYIQSYYPLLLPLLEAAHFRSMGVLDDRSVHVVEWLLLVGWVFAGVYLCRPLTRAVVAAAMLSGVAILMVQTVLTAYADVPSALFASLGILALGVWLEYRRRGDLVVASLLLIAAANVKNEGAVATAVALIAAAGVLVFLREGRRLRELGVAIGAIALLGILPWRLWLAANGIHGDHSFGKSFDVSFLYEHRSRVWPAIEALVSQIQPSSFDPRMFVPIGLAIALIGLFARARRSISAYYLSVGVLYFVGLIWGYWTSPFSGSLYDGQVYTTVVRITVGLGLIGLVAVLQLGGLRPTRARNRVDVEEPGTTPSPTHGDSWPASPPPRPTS
jgi:hypothetical protein